MRLLLVLFVGLISAVLLLSGCQNAKYLKAHSDLEKKHKRVYDEHWVVSNEIEVLTKKEIKRFKEDSLYSLDTTLMDAQEYGINRDLESSIYYGLYYTLRQKPNRKFLFGRPLLWMHNAFDTLKVKYTYQKKYEYTNALGEKVKGGIAPDTLYTNYVEEGDTAYYKNVKLRKFFMNRVGEAPSVFDSTQTRLTAQSMQNYLIEKGFLNAKVGFKVDYNQQKARVSYFYTTGKPMIIDSVKFYSADPEIHAILQSSKRRSKLVPGEPLEKGKFMEERSRITLEIRNKGYRDFSWNYIVYEADTANARDVPAEKKKSNKLGFQGEPRANIYVNVLPFSDSIKKHPVYTINNVYIVPDEPKQKLHQLRRTYKMDSTFVYLRPPRKKQEVSYMFQAQAFEDDSLVYLHIEREDDGRRIIQDISKIGTKSLVVLPGGKAPYWLKMKPFTKEDYEKHVIGEIEEEDKHKLIFVFPKKEGKSFYSHILSIKFIAKNPLNGNLYWVIIKPYKRRFIRNVYEHQHQADPSDIPIHIILRTTPKSPETDPEKIKKDLARKRKENFIIRDQVISQNVQIAAGSQYNYEARVETVNRISELGVFKFPRVEYAPSKSGKDNELDAYVYMKEEKKQNFNNIFEINNNSANVGLALSSSYINRNIFKGAESFQLNAEGGIDFRLNPQQYTNPPSGFAKWINLLDLNLTASLNFPKIVAFRNWSLSVDNPKSSIELGYRYLQQSTDFKVSSFDANFGYRWTMNQKVHNFNWNPLMLNFTLEPILNPTFEASLRESNFQLYQSLQQSFFIPGTSFTYRKASKNPNARHLFYYRFFAETTGNSVFLIDQINPNRELNFFGLPYTQYFKGDVQLNYSWKLSKSHTIATRLMAGAVAPFGNSSEVPFARQFFLGGPSSMRGWNMRFLGPGRQRPEPGAEFQLGDIRLETNVEYRFMFSSWIGGAIFADIGNIWLFNGEESAPNLPLQPAENGRFSLDFWKELAVASGVGLRMDMSFFVIRLDVAAQVHNPAGFFLEDEDGDTQLLGPNGLPVYWKFGRLNWVVAVGYPF